MPVLDLVIAPDRLLNTKSEIVQSIDKDLQKFMDDMLETMYAEKGSGLAAVQVGVLKRVMIVDINDDKNIKDPHFMVNPEIIYFSEEKIVYPEGCLSFPGGYVEISRPRAVTVRYQDYDGNIVEKETSDWFARAVQHEMDHLNGITMLNNISSIKGAMLMNKVNKYKKEHKL